MYKGVALPNGGCLMLSIEVTIEMTILMKKTAVPIFGNANNFAYYLGFHFQSPL